MNRGTNSEMNLGASSSMVADTVAWAKAYPFGHPDRSYLFRDGGAQELPDDPSLFSGRLPVIASGSNAAPRQLARKYAQFARGAAIPVTRALIHDFDSVYATHLAAYGSLPATLFPSPGTVLTSFVTWLDEAELAVMHATEQPGLHYHFVELNDIEIIIDADVDGGGYIDSAYAYVAVAGALKAGDGVGSGPVSLSAVPAEGRRYPARSQADMLALLRDEMAPDSDLDDFIMMIVGDPGLRESCRLALAPDAEPFDHPSMRIVPVD